MLFNGRDDPSSVDTMGGKRSATHRGILIAPGADKKSLLLKLTYLRCQNPHPASSSSSAAPLPGIPAAHAHITVGSQRLAAGLFLSIKGLVHRFKRLKLEVFKSTQSSANTIRKSSETLNPKICIYS